MIICLACILVESLASSIGNPCFSQVNGNVKPCDDGQQPHQCSLMDLTVTTLTLQDPSSESGTTFPVTQRNQVGALHSVRTSVVTSGTAFRYPPPFWSPTNTSFHLLGPSLCAQSYMLPASSLWVASPPPAGASWAVHQPYVTFPVPPVQLPSSTDPTDSESKGSAVPVDSVYPTASTSEEATTFLSSDSNDCTPTGNLSTRNTNHSGLGPVSTPPSATIPPAHLIPPQAFVMLCPSSPLDFLRAGLLSVDLSNGQAAQCMPPNCVTSTAQSSPTIDGGQEETGDSSSVEIFGSGDANSSIKSTVAFCATTSGMSTIPPLSRFVTLLLE